VHANLGQKILSLGKLMMKETIVLIFGSLPGSLGTVSTFWTALDFSGGKSDLSRNLTKPFLTGRIPSD